MATRKEWASRKGRESFTKKHGKLAEEIRQRDKDKCVYCGAAAKHFDHVKPKSKGGGDSKGNVVMACQRCNDSRQGRSLESWRKSQKHGLSFSPEEVTRRAQGAIPFHERVAGYARELKGR